MRLHPEAGPGWLTLATCRSLRRFSAYDVVALGAREPWYLALSRVRRHLALERRWRPSAKTSAPSTFSRSSARKDA